MNVRGDSAKPLGAWLKLAGLIAACWLMGATKSPAATFYVKPAASGAGNGTSWADAFGSNFTPARNNIYYIADGSYGNKTWTTANAGTSPITIRKATAADHGTATGWSDALGAGEALWGTWVISTDYWIFDGQWRTANSSNNWDGATSGIDYGFRIVGGGVGGKTLRLDSGGAGADHCSFEYCDFVGGGSGTGNADDVVYGIEASDTIKFSYCSLRDSDRTIFLLRGEWQNLLVQSSFMGRNNSTPANHGELLSDVGSDFVTFRNNVIEDTEGTTAGFAILNGFGSKSSANTANGWKIYGNLFRSTAAGGTISYGVLLVANNPPNNENWMDNLYFANNTIVNLNIDWDLMMVMDIPGTGNVVVNNVFYNNLAGSGTGDTAFNGMGTVSYNWYYNTASSGDVGAGKIVCSTGCSGYFQNAAGLNMTLIAPLAGTALAAEYKTDMLGNTRGADGTWDRGAFEFNAGGIIPDTNAPVLGGLAAGSIASSSAAISFTTSEAARSGVQYGPTTGYGSSATNSLLATSQNFALTGLLPNTVYHYRVSASDAAGNSTVSSDAVFQTTAVDAVAPTVGLTAPSNGAMLSNTVSLTAAASDNIGVAGVSFLLDGVVLGGEDTTSPYLIIWDTSTVANGTYSLAARARDAAGNQTTSSAITITVVASPAPVALKVGGRVAVSSDPSLRVRSTAGLAGTILGDQLVGARGTIITGPVSADGYTWWQIDYDIDPDGWSIESNASVPWLIPAPTITPDTNAPVVSGLVAGNIASSSATISFTTSEGARSGLQYGPTTGYGSSATNASLATSQSFALTGLLPNTVYHYRVSASDASGNGTVSGDTVFQTTALTVSPTIRSLTVADPSHVVILWSAISNVTYRVQARPDFNSGWVNLVPDVRATNVTASAVDNPGGAAQRFYRLLVLP